MKVMATFFALCICMFSSAQDCKNYLFLQNGKTIEMTIYNKKGEPNGKQVYAVSDYTVSGGTATAKVNTEMFDKKGKSITTTVNSIKCTGGKMLMDMKMSLAGQQASKVDASAQSFFLEYPAKISVGEALTDGHMQLDIDMNGMKQMVTMDVTNRKVDGKENITTTAGTWDCYKITSHQKLVIKTMGIGVPINTDVTEWFAPGVGIIKTESKAGGTAVTAIR